MRVSSGCFCFLLLAVGCGSDGAAEPAEMAPTAAGGEAGKSGPSTGGTVAAPDASVPAGGSGGRAQQAAGRGGAGGSAAASGAGTTAVAGSHGDAGKAGTGAATAGAAGATGPSTADVGAPEKQPLGYGKDTTGGGSKAAVEAATLDALQAAIDGYSGSGGLVLKYTGKFDFATIKDPCVQHTLDAHKLEIKKKSDVTLLGADGSAANFGIHVAASSSNIIIRNMTIGLLPGGSDSDMISLEGVSDGVPKNIWIDHNELFSSLADCPGAGDTAFDGMIDIKKGADNVTVSYNYLHDHHKASLNGYSDDDAAERHVTFHHNLFENLGSRTPLQRHGYSHMLNNYLSKILTSGINVRMGGYSLVEGNYFENVNNPVTSRDSSSVGFWDLRNNNLATPADVAAGNAFGITWDDGNDGTVNALDWKTTMAFPAASLSYKYESQPFACVRDGLRAVAGPKHALATLACH
jgi:pectate lyase